LVSNRGTAVVGAAFSLIVCIFIAANYGRSRVIDTPDELELLRLKAEIPKRPDDEQLVSGIRELDLQIRQKRARAIFRSRKGSFLLLGGVIVFLIGADRRNGQAREAKWSRWAVTAGVAMLAIGAFCLMAGPKVDLSGPGAAAAAPYPSIEEVNENWASFRGPNGGGISSYTNIPHKHPDQMGRRNR